VSALLTVIVDETVQEIQADVREDGLDLPLQAERAARQVLRRPFVTQPGVLERLYSEMMEMQEERRVVADWYEFACTSPSEFIAAAAKQRMGDEYQRLLHSSLEALAPTTAGD